MARSQNNWTVVGKSDCDQGPFEGITFPNGIRRGDVATVCRWQLRRYKALVEPIKNGTCWGWYVKKITGSEDYSNHSSGTAWDINAPQNPQGVPTGNSMTQRQIDACHQIERESDGVLRWGGDFSRPDPMHWEIVKGAADVAALAKKIRDDLEDDDVALTPEDKAWFLSAIAPSAAGVEAAVTRDPQTRAALIDLSRQGGRQGGLDVLWLAAYCKRNRESVAAGGPGDPTYLDLLPEDQHRARNAWDLMQELGLTQIPDPPAPTT